jgi:GAF domain-containing protein
LIEFLRKISVQNRLMALFVVPGILVILTIGIIVSQYRLIETLGNQLELIQPGSFEAYRVGHIGLVVMQVIIIIVLFLLTLILGRSILVPLDNLRSSITLFEIGRQKSLVRDDSNDEIGELSLALNNFARQLTGSYINLEERVNQRTQALAQRAMYLQAAAELARDTTSISDIDELLTGSVDLIKERFGLYFVGVYILDPSSNQAILRSGTGEIGRALIQRGHRYQVGEIGLVGQVVASAEPLIVHDVNTDFVYQRHQLLNLTVAQAVLPLKIGTHVVGALDIHSDNPGGFDSSAVSVLQIMADQLSVAIQNASLVEDLKVRIQETNLLYQRYAQENWSIMKLRDQEIGYEFDMVRIVHYQDHLSSDLIQSLQAGKPIIVDEPSENGETRNILYAPLMMYNQLIGVIGFEDTGGDRSWTKDEISTLETISNQISLALDNSRLIEETQRRSDQIRLLQAVTSIAASHVKLSDLLEAVAEKLCQELDIDFCDVLWSEPDGISAKYIASSTRDVEEIKVDIPEYLPIVENPLFHHLVETKRTVELYDFEHNPLAADLGDLFVFRNISNMMVTPMFLRGDVSGAILMSNKEDRRKFSSDELLLMDQISLQLSSALEVANIFERTTLQAERERQISEATQHIRETLDLPTILRSAAQELRSVLDVPEVTIRIAGKPWDDSGIEVEE